MIQFPTTPTALARIEFNAALASSPRMQQFFHAIIEGLREAQQCQAQPTATPIQDSGSATAGVLASMTTGNTLH